MHSFHFHRGHGLAQRFRNFWFYELSMWLHTLSHSLVSIFIPILILKAGFDVKMVIVYYLVYNIVDAPLNLVARACVVRWGGRYTIAFATCIGIAFFLLFSHVDPAHVSLLFVLAMLGGAYDAFYWVSHFYLFIQSGGGPRYAGKSTGLMYAVRQCALILGPATGAVILLAFDQRVLLSIVVLGLAISIAPLLSMREFSDTPSDPPQSFSRFFRFPRGRRMYLSVALYDIQDSVESILFPMFIYTLYGTLKSVAAIPVILSVSAILASFFLGRIRSRGREFVITLGASLIALMWCARIFAGGQAIYYLTVLGAGLCAYLVLVPLDSSLFEYGVRIHDPLSASMYRNVGYMGTNIILFGLLLIVSNVFATSFAVTLVCLLFIVLLDTSHMVSKLFRAR